LEFARIRISTTEILPFPHQLAPGKPSIVPQKGCLASIWLDYNQIHQIVPHTYLAWRHKEKLWNQDVYFNQFNYNYIKNSGNCTQGKLV
jgi:hypothetical protein